MREEFIEYLWLGQKFDQTKLQTTNGKPFKIIHPGKLNVLKGPDFLGGKIELDSLTLAGNIELHVRSSDFKKHQHKKDPAFANLILHVVWEVDCIIPFLEDHNIPTLELKPLVSEKLLGRYKKLKAAKSYIACADSLHLINQPTRHFWLERTLIERIETKTKRIIDRLNSTKNDLEQVFFETLCRYFGVSRNKESFEKLGMQLPFKLLKKQLNLEQIEALLFGQAGFLNASLTEEYPSKLYREYLFLAKKYQLPSSLSSKDWHFFRMYPNNFPTIRLAQLAVAVYKNPNFFQRCMEAQNLKEVKQLFDFEPSSYWKDHYTFKKESKSKSKKVGAMLLHILIINVIVPFRFAYGQRTGQLEECEKAIDLLGFLPVENNQIIRKYKALGFSIPSAAQSQAILELQSSYCKKGRCLKCGIGNKLMQQFN